MIHLFNKIYIKGDHQVKMERDRIIISPTYGGVGVYTTKFTTIVSNQQQGTIHYSAKSLQELLDVNFGGSSDNFFRYLVGYDADKRLTIYADLPTMLQLVTTFYKTIFPQMAPETYIKVMKLIFLRINYLFGAGFLPFVKIPTDQALDYRMAARDILEDVNGLKALWASTKAWRLTKAMRTIVVRGASVEFQLATYLADPKWAYRRDFETKVVAMVKKQMVHNFMLEVHGNIMAGLYRLDVLEPTANWDPTKNTLEDFIAQFPQYKFLLDDKFHPDNYEYVWKAYDPTVLGSIGGKLFKLLYAGDEHEGLTDIYDGLFKKNLSMNDIISFEMTTPSAKILWTSDNYDEAVNSYFIDMLLKARYNGDMNTIQQFALL